MKLTPFVLAILPLTSASSSSLSYKLIGDGSCVRQNENHYDFVRYDQIETLDVCASSKYCGREEVRGFTYDDMKHCVCLFDDGYSLESIPADMKSSRGFNPYGTYFGNKASGEIKLSDQDSIVRQCYSNLQFKSRFNHMGDGTCTNEEGKHYNSIIFEAVVSPELCGSPQFCGRSGVRGFVLTDLDFCICYFDTESIPEEDKITQIKQYNTRHTNVKKTTKALGPITKSDNQHSSMLLSCYSFHTKNDDTPDLHNLRGSSVE